MDAFKRFLIALTPADRADWIIALLSESASVGGRWNRISWYAGSLWLFGWLHLDLIKSDPKSILGGFYMKTVTGTLSIIGAIAGFFLIGLFFMTTDPTIVPLLLGVGMLVQSLFTILYLARSFKSYEAHARNILLAGQTVALTVAVVGGVIATVSNINPPNGDYEYGPMTMFGLIALQATVAIYIAAFGPPTSRSAV